MKAAERMGIPYEISIHALCEEGDSTLSIVSPEIPDFYPRPLRGGRPPWHRRTCWPKHISIHALCEEGDANCGGGGQPRRDFYPRPLRGGRLNAHAKRSGDGIFLSTPSARRATGARSRAQGWRLISIHALREEGDCRNYNGAGQRKQFLSTPSARRATVDKTPEPFRVLISIHALREEGDQVKSTKAA